MRLGRANSPWNEPWRRLNKKYCKQTLDLQDQSPLKAQEMCVKDVDNCESVYRDGGFKSNGDYKLCQKGYIRDLDVGTDYHYEHIGSIMTKGKFIRVFLHFEPFLSYQAKN